MADPRAVLADFIEDSLAAPASNLEWILLEELTTSLRRQLR